MILPSGLHGAPLGFNGSGGGSSPTAQQIADAVWNASQSSYTTQGTMATRFADIEELLINPASVTNEVGGSRLITFFEADGITVKHRVRISADGLTRTVVP